jgi:pyrimidine-specific ribonucleoside hydrolase
VTAAVDDAAMSPLHRRPAVLLTALLLLLVGACAPASSADPATPSVSAASPSGAPAGAPRPVIIDADMDVSDLLAVMVLLRDPALDVRAIAIDGTGLVHCAGGRRATRYLVDQLGRSDVPYACGREDPGPDGRSFPDDWRAVADDAYGLPIPPQIQDGLPPDAVDLLREAIDTSPTPPTIVALGPWTNLEDALAADPSLSGRIAGVHAMLGTLEAPGNVFVDGFDGGDPFEWNAFADPSAVEAVLATDVPITVIPLDATDDVPVPADLVDRLAAVADAGGANLAWELLLRFPGRLAADEGQQLWDELAALTVSRPDLVTWQDGAVVVAEHGALRTDPAGRPIRSATSADATAVGDALVDALAVGGPRTTPFAPAGTLAATWDGTTCTMTAPPSPGLYQVTYQGPAGTPNGVMVAGVRPPGTWSDLTTFLEELDLTKEVQEPAWLLQGGQLVDERGAGTTIGGMVDIEPGSWGPICLVGTWPDLDFTAGEGTVVSD